MRISQGAVWLPGETSRRKHGKVGTMLTVYPETRGCRSRSYTELAGKLRTCPMPLSSETQRLLSLCQKADREPAPNITRLDQGNPASKADVHSSLQYCGNKILAFAMYQAVCYGESMAKKKDPAWLSRSSQLAKQRSRKVPMTNQ